MVSESKKREQLAEALGDICGKVLQLAGMADDNSPLQRELETLKERLASLLALVREVPGSAALPAPKTVLVVDDNQEVRDFIVCALTLADYKTLEAADGEAALAAIRTVPDIDLVLCDVILPDVNGPELMQTVRKRLGDVKVVYMSGYVSDGLISQEVERTVAMGGRFIQKPFSTRELLDKLNDVMQHEGNRSTGTH